MCKILCFATALWVLVLGVSVQAQVGARLAIRSCAGFEVTAPEGWSWEETVQAEVRFISQSASSRGYPLDFRLNISSDDERRETMDLGWNVSEYRRLDDGGEIHWGFTEGMSSYQHFIGFIRRGNRWVDFSAAHKEPSPSDRSRIEQAFFEIARTLRVVPMTNTIANPVRQFEVEIPPEGCLDRDDWIADVRAKSPNFITLKGREPGGVRAYIRVYPAWDNLRNLEAVIADITGHYAKKGIQYDRPQPLKFTGGEALWTEAPGAKWPYLGAVWRSGKFYFVSVEVRDQSDQRRLKEVFLATLRSVRPLGTP